MRWWETGVPVQQSGATTGLAAPQPLPEGLNSTGSAEGAKAEACFFSWVYMIAVSQGCLNDEVLCSF